MVLGAVMYLKELIEALQDDLEAYGNIEVRAETPKNQTITGTLYALLRDTGRYTLFLMLEEAE